MSFIASLRSMPHAKLRRTWLRPSEDCEVICSTPDVALSAPSSGRVTSSSISSGPTPG